MDKTIQEKLTTIAENRPKIYNNGVNDGIRIGRDEVIDNSKYIPKQAIGKVITLNDVSEVYHKVKVYGDGKVDVYGKNLFDISTDTRFTQQEDGSYINSVRIGSTVKNPLNLPHNTYTLSYDMSCPVGNNARIRIYLKDGSSVDTSQASTGNFLHFETKIVGEIESWGLYYASTPQEETLLIKNAQIEVGSIATDYEPYNKQTITATPVGTEISSMCPVMIFITDEEIKVDYYSSFGMQTEYDRFWDSCQNNGTRQEYTYAFSGYGWTDITFKPKYDIRPKIANGLFQTAKITDLVAALERAGVVLDTSNANSSASIFRSAYLTRVPFFVAPTSSTGTYMFNNATALHTIEGIKCSETTVYTSWFTNCTSLTHCIFSGIIANDINLQWSKLLDKESLVSLAVTLASFIDTELNPEGSNIDPGQAWTRTITLSPESWAILDNTPYPDAPMLSCTEFITTVKAWNKA